MYSSVHTLYYVHCTCTVLCIYYTMCIVHVQFCAYQKLCALNMCTFLGVHCKCYRFLYIRYYVHCTCTVMYTSYTMCIVHVQFCAYQIHMCIVHVQFCKYQILVALFGFRLNLSNCNIVQQLINAVSFKCPKKGLLVSMLKFRL